MTRVNSWKYPCAIFLFLAVTASASLAQTFTTLVNFNQTNGETPLFPLVQGFDGNIYGATSTGGVSSYCPPTDSCGTVFKITSSGVMTTIYNFCAQRGCPDGYLPLAGLTLGSDGNFYGTTHLGGNLSCDSGNGCGTIFRITDAGTLTMLHQFDFADGEGPGVLMQATNGAFFGTTTFGGTGRYYGTVFSLDVGLGPFVETNPTMGKAGAKVAILGNNLKGATSVTFDGLPTTFKAYASVILATVPAGATTGTVQVTMPSGTLKSKVPFLVIP